MADKVIKQIHPQGLVLPSLPGQIKELRVAAYARVSTSSDEQMGSVAAQKDYFEKMIIKKPGWILVPEVFQNVHKHYLPKKFV